MTGHPLALGAAERLDQLEALIAGCVRTAVASLLTLGYALREVQGHCLAELRQRGFQNFEDYCQRRWRIERSAAYRYLNAARVHDALTAAGLSSADDVPTSEKQYRALSLVPAGHEAAAWQDFRKTGQPATGDRLRTFVHGWLEGRGLRPANPRTGHPTRYSELIKPTDQWCWPVLTYPRLIGEPGHWGYVPGEVYANVLWYWARPGGVVVDPMAGSGMLWLVYEDRARWGIGRDDLEFSIGLFDLHPRGPYADRICQHDLLTGFPAGVRADTVILDPPYPLMVRGQYSDSPRDLANLGPHGWCEAMAVVARHCADAQGRGGVCVVLCPAVISLRHGRGRRWLAWDTVTRLFQRAGYCKADEALASRRVQQEQSADQARVNCLAKARRVLLSETTKVLCFRRR